MKRSALSHDEQLMKLARVVARLERKARGLRSELKLVSQDLKHARKELKVYTQTIVDRPWNEMAPPLRTFGEH